MAAALRPWLLVLFVLGFAVSLSDFPFAPRTQLSGRLEPVPGLTDTFRTTSTRRLVVVGGTLAAGDRVTLMDPTWQNRLQAAPLDSPPLRVRSERTGQTLFLSAKPPARTWLSAILRVIVELLAIVLLVARGAAPGVAPLAAALFFGQFFLFAHSGTALGPAWNAFYASITQAGEIAASWALMLLGRRFAPSTRATRWTFRVVSAAAFAAAAITVAAQIERAVAGRIEPFGFLMLQAGAAIPLAGALLIFARGIAATEGSDRRRLVILTAALIAGNTDTLLQAVSTNITFSAWQVNVSLAGAIIMTIGLAYAVLVEHMFDVALVVNRAVVYGATSAVVVLAFIVIEWFVARTATQFGHVGSTIVELGLAIAVGLSLKPLHARTDRIVDAVIFAARHRAANAILRFADECGECRTVESLIQLTLETIRLFGRTAGCALYLADENGDLIMAPGGDLVTLRLDADDAAVIRMRASRAPVERASFPQLREGDYAFPMARRRGLAGAIVCALPPRAEPYSPEERDGLAVLAREVGTAIIALEASTAGRLAAEAERLEEEVARLRARLDFLEPPEREGVSAAR